MSTAELKSSLHQLVVETDDVNILVQIREVFLALRSGELDWMDFISDKEQKMIDIGLHQADEGQLIPHEEVRKRIDQWKAEKQ